MLTPQSIASDFLVFGFFSTLSTYYSRNLSEEAFKSKLIKAKLGYYPEAAPVGYKSVPVNRKKQLAIDEEKAQFIKNALNYTQQVYSLTNHWHKECNKTGL